MVRPIALTGTPGTGKTTVARHLTSVRVVEVAELAAVRGFSRRTSHGTEVDLRALARAVRSPRSLSDMDVVVGHLSHLLPLRDVVVLRCHPLELARRLGRAGRGTARERTENIVAEATDVIRWEAVGPGRRIFQVDTTGRTAGAVARDVLRFARTRTSVPAPRIDWLADRRVTDYLLDRAL